MKIFRKIFRLSVGEDIPDDAYSVCIANSAPTRRMPNTAPTRGAYQGNLKVLFDRKKLLRQR